MKFGFCSWLVNSNQGYVWLKSQYSLSQITTYFDSSHDYTFKKHHIWFESQFLSHSIISANYDSNQNENFLILLSWFKLFFFYSNHNYMFWLESFALFLTFLCPTSNTYINYFFQFFKEEMKNQNREIKKDQIHTFINI